MSSNDPKLSTDEMAALRDVSAPDAADENSGEEAARVQVLDYNFRQPGRLSASQLRALKVVHEFFAKRLSEERPSGLNLAFELSLCSVETISYSNFMGSLGNPCFMALLSTRFEQSVLMEMDLGVVRTLVSRILGDEDEQEENNRAPTAIEQGIAGQWLEGLLPLLSESWSLSSAVDFGLQSIECDPRFVQVMPDDHPVVSLTFQLRAGNARGRLTLCYPLEPLQELLEGMSLRMCGNDEEEDDESGGDRILRALKQVPFELRAELGTCSIRADHLASLRVGDVLCLDRTVYDDVDVFLGSSAVFKAGLGRKGDTLALQLRNRCRRD